VAAAIVALILVGVAGGAVGALIAGRTSTSNSTGSTPLTIDNRVLPSAAQGDAASVAGKLNPSVGTIVVTTAGGGGLGSGFVISNSGSTSYLLTNNHVVAGASTVNLIMPTDRTYTATVVGTDSFDDLAVISVQDGHLPAATFGDSNKLVAGQSVIAIGSPLGNVGSITSGVISALHRTIQAGDQSSGSQETLQDVLQTDASINPGNSGGPLADAGGRVVGVNVADSSQATNIGFSIPSNIAQRVATALIAHQPIRIPYMGIGYTDPVTAAENGQSYNEPGLKLTTVQAGSPAAGAGLQVGDVLTTIDGVALTNGQTLGGIIQTHTVGDTLTMVVIRSGQSMTLHLTLGARPTTSG
jgi:S1-C subfamily serine protease